MIQKKHGFIYHLADLQKAIKMLSLDYVFKIATVIISMLKH